MKVVNIIETGSKPKNCVALFDGEIVIDLGIKSNHKELKKILPNIKFILLTHEHGDHIHIPTLRYVLQQRPSVKILGAQHMQDYLDSKNPGEFKLEVLDIGGVYRYNNYIISPFGLNHNVPNVGYHVQYIADKPTNDLVEKTFKTIYITDSGSYPEDLKAPNYQVYLLEVNYLESMVHDLIRQEIEQVGFSHRSRSLVDHLSDKDTETWWKAQGGAGTLIPLHMSEAFREIIKEKYGV